MVKNTSIESILDNQIASHRRTYLDTNKTLQDLTKYEIH